MRSSVRDIITKYVAGWSEAATQLSGDQLDQDDQVEFAVDGDLARVMTQSMSLLGFLDACAEHANFWSPYDRLVFIENVRSALTEKFSIAFETARMKSEAGSSRWAARSI